jgi:hypothetical protein
METGAGGRRRSRATRAFAGVVVAAAAVEFALIAARLPAFPCPTQALGFTCPGCGLGRGVVALLSGDFESMLRLHAFAPLAVLGLVLLALSAALPAPHGPRVAEVLARAASRRTFGVAMGAALVIYWIVRTASGGAGAAAASAA